MTKLSEAILIGSTVVSARPGNQYNMKEKTGCAIGMAILGAGGSFARPTSGPGLRYRSEGLEWWSWTSNLERRPCRCWIVPEVQVQLIEEGRVWAWIRSFWTRKMAVKDIITHLFDRHVFGKRDWTIERLAQWVASVEPPAREPVISRPQKQDQSSPLIAAD
jgi:hypothetical protein